MKELVQFSCMKLKDDIRDKYDYVDSIAKELKRLKIIPECTSGIVLKFDDSYNLEELEENSFYLIDFKYGDDKFEIIFEFGTFKTCQQLNVRIYSDSYLVENNLDELSYLHNLKISIKKFLKDKWDKFIWCYDRESENFAIRLYPEIYSTENLLRTLINEVMTKEYGFEWWEQFVPIKLKDKHIQRMKSYKSIVPSFRDVDETLMSIDVGDLLKILKLEIKHWIPKENEQIDNILNGLKTYSSESAWKESLIKILKSQSEIKNDLWNDKFSKYLSDEFFSKFKIFELNRNHIAHNKLLDKNAYDQILKSVLEVKELIQTAISKFNKEVISKESKEYLEKEKRIELEEQEAFYSELMQEEAGVSILTKDEIEDLFNEKMTEFYDEISNDLRFRNDLEISEPQHIQEDDKWVGVFIIKYKITEESILIKYFFEIDDYQGSTSILYLDITDGNKSLKNFEITYINGEVSYNSEQCYYMPETEDEFAQESLDNAYANILNFINEHFEDLKQKVDEDMYSILKDGGQSPITDLACYECGELYICINEEYAEFGTCLNCGAKNDITICERCECYFQVEDDEVPALCQNCIEYYKKQ